MKTLSRSLHCALLSVCIFSLANTFARADEIVSLDDPAPTATNSAAGAPSQNVNTPTNASTLESLDGSAASIGNDAAVDLDAGGSESAFNPYLFSRTAGWMLLPLLSLILLGLHLLPIPKRSVVQKIDQAQRFFRVNDQDKTGMIQIPTAAQLAPKSGNLNVDEKTPVGEAKTRVFIRPGSSLEKSPNTSSKVFVPKGEED